MTSASLMARAGASNEAIELALTLPSLGVGCHIVLVDGQSVLSPREIPTLANAKTGLLHGRLTPFLARLFTGCIRPVEIEAETSAQIELLHARGVRLTHIDTHKHLHIFPQVLRPVLRAARANGIRAVRNPFEPVWAVRATAGASLARCAEVNVLRKLEATCRQIIAEEGFATADGTIAMAGTGILDAAMVRSLLEQLPEGTWELVTHPGYNDGDLERVRTRLRGSREIEREAIGHLKDGQLNDIALLSFAELAVASIPESGCLT